MSGVAVSAFSSNQLQDLLMGDPLSVTLFVVMPGIFVQMLLMLAQKMYVPTLAMSFAAVEDSLSSVQTVRLGLERRDKITG